MLGRHLSDDLASNLIDSRLEPPGIDVLGRHCPAGSREPLSEGETAVVRNAFGNHQLARLVLRRELDRLEMLLVDHQVGPHVEEKTHDPGECDLELLGPLGERADRSRRLMLPARGVLLDWQELEWNAVDVDELWLGEVLVAWA